MTSRPLPASGFSPGEHPVRVGSLLVLGTQSLDRVAHDHLVMVQRPADPYAVQHSWDGPHRGFACWYINHEADHCRSETGCHTQDARLPDGWADH